MAAWVENPPYGTAWAEAYPITTTCGPHHSVIDRLQLRMGQAQIGFVLSLFCCRFSFSVCLPFFCTSRLPLSLLPLSPILSAFFLLRSIFVRDFHGPSSMALPHDTTTSVRIIIHIRRYSHCLREDAVSQHGLILPIRRVAASGGTWRWVPNAYGTVFRRRGSGGASRHPTFLQVTWLL